MEEDSLHETCLVNYYQSPHFKIIKDLTPLSTGIHKFFGNDIRYMSRDEYADGSCFFHSIVTCLNIHEDINDSKNRFASQQKLFQNIKIQLERGGINDTSKTSKFNNFLHKHLFVHDDYHTLGKKQQMSLGHELRRYIRSSLDEHWDNYWKPKNKKLAYKLKNVHDREHVRSMFSNPKEWADVYMILYVMHVLNINLWFFDNVTSTIYCGVHGSDIKEQPTMFILWTNHSHFQPIVKLECSNSGRAFIKSIFTYKDPIVKSIEAQYQQNGCHLQNAVY